MNPKFQLGLLYLIHLLIGVDGVEDEKELRALQCLKDRENIPDDVFQTYQQNISCMTEREIYLQGIELMNKCSEQEKLKAFSTLYRLSEVDGRVHVKEIRLLLYSLKDAGLNFDDVVHHTKEIPSLL
jgi:hypothetical protein